MLLFKVEDVSFAVSATFLDAVYTPFKEEEKRTELCSNCVSMDPVRVAFVVYGPKLFNKHHFIKTETI